MSKRRNLLESEEKRKTLEPVITAARSNLRAVLQEKAESEDESEEENPAKSDSSIPIRGRPPKRFKEGESSGVHQQTYIMKLFDRSVDLARFGEDTELYPICRAWMQNQPRSRVKKLEKEPTPPPRDNDEDIVEKYEAEEITEIHQMPAPTGEEVSKLPPALPDYKLMNKDNINLDYGKSKLPTKAAILKEYKEKWGRVRDNWINHVKKREERYETSCNLLEALFQA